MNLSMSLNPNQVFKVQRQVKVTMLEGDLPRKRTSLSMKIHSSFQLKTRSGEEYDFIKIKLIMVHI